MNKSVVSMCLAGGAAGLLLAGCFDVEEAVSLQRDLSGRAGFRMTVDLEPMVAFMASMQHSMSGKPGEVTPEELAEARKGFLEKQKSDDPAKKRQELSEQKAQVEKSLPPGVKLLSSSIEDQGLKMVARFEFGFDDVRKLAKIKMPEKKGDQPGQNPYQEPFAGLKVVDEGSTVLVTLAGVDPKAAMKNQGGAGGDRGKGGPSEQRAPGGPGEPGAPGGEAGQAGQGLDSPEMQKALAAAFQNARFAFKLESPFEVVTTNATRRDGHTLYWEVKATDPNANLPQTLSARFKK